MSGKALLPNRKRASWGSYTAFLVAAIGASIGLGNLWKFPYEAGLHGGGTFLLVYLPAVVLVAFPLMVAELMIGRLGQSNPIFSTRRLAHERKLSLLWQSIGWFALITSLLVFSFYSVVAGWTLYYVMNSLIGAFQDMPAEIVQHSFGALLRNSEQLVLWHSAFVVLVIVVLAKDIRRGLEAAMRWLMPVFFIGLGWLMWVVADLGNFSAALEFMFTVRWEFLSLELFVAAVAQALFSMSIGIGIIMLYGSYISDHRPLFTTAAIITASDTLIAVGMSLLIFSIVFAFGLRPDSGAGLIFETLPVAFAQMHEGSIWISAGFFIFMATAALFSGFALLEPVIAWIRDRWGLSRRRAAWIAGTLGWLLGFLSIQSLSGESLSFYYFGSERDQGYFDVVNILTTQLLIPITALVIAAFVGWRLTRAEALDTLNVSAGVRFRIWRLGTRYFAPATLIAVILIVLFIPA